ncbi:MAG TPA: hypothetical protein VFD56_15070, partial [Chitinophagaceae bacterium]|nr:hypothetical protein [Chitinophagaceae bacterium]
IIDACWSLADKYYVHQVTKQPDTISSANRSLFGINDLIVVNDPGTALINGDFSVGYGLVAYIYKFLPGKSFEYFESSCMGNYLLSKGKFEYSIGKKLILSPKGEKRINFTVYKFDKYFFLIPISKENDFKNSFVSIAKAVYDRVKYEDDRNSDQHSIAFQLSQNYYTRID